MAFISKIQEKASTWYGSTPQITLDSVPTEGNRLVLITGARLYSSFNQAPIVSSISQTNVTWNWLRRESNPAGGNTLGSEVWISDPIGASTPGTVITINYSTTEYKYSADWAAEYHGLFKSTGLAGVVDAHGGKSSVYLSTSTMDVDDSGGPATASNGERLLLCNAAQCCDVGTGLYSNPTNGYSIAAQPYNSISRRVRNGVFEKIIYSGPEIVELQVTTSASTNAYCDNVLSLNAQVPILKTHTTDSILKNTYTKSQTTDSYLQGVYDENHLTDSYLSPSPRSHNTDSLLFERLQRAHDTDSLLLGNLQKAHSTSAFLRGEIRTPLFSKNITRTIPPGINSGKYNVKLFGMSGNAKASQQLEYLRPDQEVTIGSGRLSELYVVDGVIKKKP